jgi:hypothetical protein
MREGLVDIKKLNVFRFVIEFYRLPTGDVAEIRGSRQAAERQNRIGTLARKLPNVHWVTLIIDDRDVRDLLADLGGYVKPRHRPFGPWYTHASSHAHSRLGKCAAAMK